MKLSVCVFIKDNDLCGFGLWESMVQLMPLANEFIVWDMGSNDGTFETLRRIADVNGKLKVERHEFPINPITGMIDAGSFAMVPNEMIRTAKHDAVMYYQADEIFHETLIRMLEYNLKGCSCSMGNGFSFWRYQLQHNFQQIKWFPHLVHRIGPKSDFIFDGDGMNTQDVNRAKLISNFDGGYFPRWGAEFKNNPQDMPTHEMILDISSLGGFLDNVKIKRKKHAPYWRENENEINLGGEFHNIHEWYDREKENPQWTATESPFKIPEIIKPQLGKLKYTQRGELIEKLKTL